MENSIRLAGSLSLKLLLLYGGVDPAPLAPSEEEGSEAESQPTVDSPH